MVASSSLLHFWYPLVFHHSHPFTKKLRLIRWPQHGDVNWTAVTSRLRIPAASTRDTAQPRGRQDQEMCTMRQHSVHSHKYTEISQNLAFWIIGRHHITLKTWLDKTGSRKGTGSWKLKVVLFMMRCKSWKFHEIDSGQHQHYPARPLALGTNIQIPWFSCHVSRVTPGPCDHQPDIKLDLVNLFISNAHSGNVCDSL